MRHHIYNHDIRTAFRTANTIFRRIRPDPIQFIQGTPFQVSLDRSRVLLTRDERDYIAGFPHHLQATELTSYQRHNEEEGLRGYWDLRDMGIEAPHQLWRRYFVDVAGLAPYPGGPAGVATIEAREILRINRAPNEISVYWVPGIKNPNASGHTLCGPIYQNVPRSLEGIFMRPGALPTTLAHEFGHLLTRAGHCDFAGGVDSIVENSAPPDNLMHGDGDARTNTNLTQNQVLRIYREGRASGYIE